MSKQYPPSRRTRIASKVLSLVANCWSLAAASREAGISVATFNRWRRADSRIDQLLIEARSPRNRGRTFGVGDFPSLPAPIQHGNGTRDETKIAAILDLIRAGWSARKATDTLGVPRSSWRDWLNRDDDLRANYRAAQEFGQSLPALSA